MGNELVSIIVPLYQAADTIQRCLDSIIEQSYKNIQIIIVDDGSTDGSGDICDAYRKRDSRIVVIHTQNQGSVLARKEGLDRAEGEYIGFVDADDYIKPDMIMKMHRVIKDSGADFVHGWFLSEYSNGRVCEVSPYNKEYVICTESDREELIWEFFLNDETKLTPSMWSKIYKAEFVRRAYNFLPSEQCFGEDYIFLLCCLATCKRIKIIDDCDYIYTIRKKSLSHLEKGIFFQKRIELLNTAIRVNAELNFPVKKNLIEYWLRSETISTLQQSAIGDLRDFVIRFYIRDIEKYRNKKLVLYGAGNVGMDYIRQFEERGFNKPVAVLDKEKESLLWDEFYVHKPEYIVDKEYDVIIIAVYSKKVAMSIEENLVSIGVPKYKIVWEMPNV